ncbi:unnamed protein product [Heligmosomoides polygyrus]|uniref:Uncharacterized protein n=1 Tax=Heligmosomoides polygyrus TaxID=6339 RepID=A0A3P7Z0G3_HELPZ|nr:unnamed protein product [Heligmosomoides polygyrus]
MIEREEKFVRNAPSGGPFENNSAKRLWEPSHAWRDVALVNDQLYLSPEETAFLSIDLNLLLVSENKKELTSGLANSFF